VHNVWAKASSQGRLWVARSEKTTSSTGDPRWRLSCASFGVVGGAPTDEPRNLFFSRELSYKEAEKKKQSVGLDLKWARYFKLFREALLQDEFLVTPEGSTAAFKMLLPEGQVHSDADAALTVAFEFHLNSVDDESRASQFVFALVDSHREVMQKLDAKLSELTARSPGASGTATQTLEPPHGRSLGRAVAGKGGAKRKAGGLVNPRLKRHKAKGLKLGGDSDDDAAGNAARDDSMDEPGATRADASD